MRYSALLSLAALAGPSVVSAYPRGRRAAAANATSADVTVLRFAEALQHLEDEFYKAGVAKFKNEDFTQAGFSSPELVLEQITGIRSDEQTHATVLGDALAAVGQKTIEGCSFDFGAALDSVGAMVATARVVENVGVSAFLGAAQLITDPVLLTAAATILTVESRHQTLLNIFAGTGHVVPQAFDIPLVPAEILAIAGPFVKGCDLGVGAPLPTLAVTNKDAILGPGIKLEFASAALNSSVDTSKAFCQMLAGGMPMSAPFPMDSCVIPDGVTGPVAIYITSDTQPLAGNPKDRAMNKILAGPTMAFIDPKAQALAAMARTVEGVQLISGDAAKASSDSSSSSNSTSAASNAAADPKAADNAAKFPPVNDAGGKWGEVPAKP